MPELHARLRQELAGDRQPLAPLGHALTAVINWMRAIATRHRLSAKATIDP